jgi:hypothetical protein
MRHRQETADAISLRLAVYGIRPGYSYPPFWNVLISEGSDTNDDGTHFTTMHVFI